MKLELLACVALLLAASASAQAPAPQAATLRMPSQAIQPLTPAVPTTASATPSEIQVNTAEARMQREITELRRENERLKAENAALSQRVENFTSLGGSEVHAYCQAAAMSANTAGVTRDCGLYACDGITGMCKDRCTSSDDCSENAKGCNAGQCVRLVLESES